MSALAGILFPRASAQNAPQAVGRVGLPVRSGGNRFPKSFGLQDGCLLSHRTSRKVVRRQVRFSVRQHIVLVYQAFFQGVAQ